MKKRYLPFGYQITDGKTKELEHSREVPSKNCREHDNEENAVP